MSKCLATIIIKKIPSTGPTTPLDGVGMVNHNDEHNDDNEDNAAAKTISDDNDNQNKNGY